MRVISSVQGIASLLTALLVAVFAAAAVWAGSYTVTCTYDSQGRISQAAYDNGTVIEYSYDLAGNRTSKTISGANPASKTPTVDTPVAPVSSITTAGAKLGATIESNGGSTISSAGIAYGMDINYGSQKTTNLRTGAFLVDVTGLSSNTVYHFRGYATNSQGTGYTSDSSFTTVPGAPNPTGPTAINNNGFTANWTPPSGNGSITGYYLDVANDKVFTSFVTGYKNMPVSGTSSAVTGLSEGKTYYYRVRAVNESGTGASSNYQSVPLVPPTTISITSPAGGASLTGTGSCSITWTYTGNPGTVKIELYEGASKVSTISGAAAGGKNETGSYSWTIPGNLQTGSDYHIKISSTTVSSCTATSDAFGISAPAIQVTSPKSGDTLTATASYPINWSWTGKLAPFKIELYNGVSRVSVIAAASNEKGSHSWTVPGSLQPGNNYSIKISSTVVTSCTVTGDAFVISAPAIHITSPKSGDTLNAGGSYSINWTWTGNPGPFKIELYKGSSKISTIAASTKAGTQGTSSYPWTVPKNLAVGSGYYVKISSTVASSCTAASDAFAIDKSTASAFFPEFEEMPKNRGEAVRPDAFRPIFFRS